MGFIRSRFGVVIWCVIALLILIVPLWRLRATRQWRNPLVQLSRDSQTYGLTPQLSQEAARRFPDDVTAQLATLRGLNWVGVGANSDFDNPDFRLAEREYFARYDALEKRFPRANAVRAQRLLDGTRGPLAIDEGPPSEKSQADPRPAPKVEARCWLTPRTLNGLVQSARQAAQIEPDNAFFPWMEAVFEFAAKRDAAALAALERAGRCARFDDYITAEVSDRLELAGRFHTLGWEDDFSEYSNALLPHLAKIRTAARAAMGRARVARRGGDTARALQIAGIVMCAGTVVARSQGIAVTVFVGAALRSLAWEQAIEDLPNAPRLEDFRAANDSTAPFNSSQEMIARTRAESRAASEQYKRALRQRFARYARDNGRADLAREALSDAGEPAITRLGFEWDEPPFNLLFQRAQALASAHWLGAMALRLTLAGASLWLALWPLAARVARAARRATLLAAMFSAGASAALLYTLSRAPAVVSLEPPRTYALPAPPTDAFTFWLDNLPWIALGLWVVPFAVAVATRESPIAARALKGAALLMAWGAWAWGAGVATMNYYGPLVTFNNPAPTAREANQLLAVLAVGALVGGLFIGRWARRRGLLAPALVGAALWLGAAAISVTSFSRSVPTFDIIGSYWMALGVAALPFWVRDLEWRRDGTRLVLNLSGIVAGLVAIWVGLRMPELPAFPALFLLMLGLVLAALCLFWLARARGNAKVAQLCFIVWACANLLLSWSSRSPGHGDRLFNSTLAAMILILPLAGLYLWRDAWKGKIRFRLNGQPTRFSAPEAGLLSELAARTRIAAGALALLGAVAYFGLALWTIPVEAQTRAMVQRQLQIGEVAWLREQGASNSGKIGD